MLPRRFISLVTAACAFLAIPLPSFSQHKLPGLEDLRLAAERGEPDAEHKFGEVFLGQGDYVSAFRWFQKAADQSVLDSQYRLGELLLDGKPKLKADSDKALEWLLIAANQGHQLAQWQLAHCFEGGKAVKRDIVEAYKWNKLLANKGQMLTQQSMDRFVLGMTHEQIQQGEQRAKTDRN